MNLITYGRVGAWFEYLNGLITLGCPTRDQIDQLAEVKASRDILVHNKGIASSVYVEKSGTRARYKDGEALEVREDYHRASWHLIRQLVTDMSNAALAKGRSVMRRRETARAHCRMLSSSRRTPAWPKRPATRGACHATHGCRTRRPPGLVRDRAA